MTARILIIAGSDSGGGAGIQADIKTVTMMGAHAMTAIAAITAQNTLGVQAVHAVPTAMVLAQIDSVVSDIGVDAVKIGMIGSAETAEKVADRLSTLSVPIVFDPVMAATSGSVLADARTISAFGRLMDVASVVTPNLPELNALGGIAPVLRHGCHVLVKGGHGEGDEIVDQLLGPNGKLREWRSPRIATGSTHGTGCTLASAVAAGLGQGMSAEAAVDRAIEFVRLALRDAPGLGGGHGPMAHQRVREDAMVAGASLNQITVGADDYAASVGFYRALGLTQIVDSPGNGYARFEAANGVTLSIHEGAVSPTTIIYFEHRALDGWVAQLQSDGLAFDQLPQDESWGWREARLTDPAGNSICLYSAGEMRRYPPWRI
ncbi:MAG: bifunctional hydroxymethylpyrimidine kinase/phosphomethylpyrimidine kinase [Sphingopyxis sp.]|nr:bifunctional hydroxymethylpyrimidine kinase/phosphomethylpyrimidine kinase [Sphingopyxis sp.]